MHLYNPFTLVTRHNLPSYWLRRRLAGCRLPAAGRGPRAAGRGPRAAGCSCRPQAALLPAAACSSKSESLQPVSSSHQGIRLPICCRPPQAAGCRLQVARCRPQAARWTLHAARCTAARRRLQQQGRSLSQQRQGSRPPCCAPGCRLLQAAAWPPLQGGSRRPNPGVRDPPGPRLHRCRDRWGMESEIGILSLAAAGKRRAVLAAVGAPCGGNLHKVPRECVLGVLKYAMGSKVSVL